MSAQAKQLARKSLVNECFDVVAKIPIVRNKWITADAWFNLIKSEITSCKINDISLQYVTKYLLSSGSRIVTNSIFPNSFGYYCRKQMS